MSASTAVMDDFKTPDRKPPQSGQEAKKESSEGQNTAATVTPPESSMQMETPEDKHVRFDKEKNQIDAKAESSAGDSPSSTNSQRGLVSTRGRRAASPGRAASIPTSIKKESNVLEFKTFRSPSGKAEESDTVPSLCSAGSMDTKDKETALQVKLQAAGADSTAKEGDKKPSSISCDSALDQTSPLAADGSAKSKSTMKKGSGKNNVTFSPVPPTKDHAVARTPTKSPNGQFQNLPNLDDATLRSPGAFFLSPHPPTPSYQALRDTGSFDAADIVKDGKKTKSDPKLASLKSPKSPKSPRTPRRDDRDRFLTTPTDFATDYGKHPNSASFDNSNVLAWLQSPTANGLFSPGGFGSMLNTPRGGPRTPRTPTVSTSFFFSDVAGLPRDGISPKSGGDNSKRGGRGYSNIICISPLASSKGGKNGTSHSNTPTINYKEMFASPAERSRGLSLLGDSPTKGLKARGVNRSTSRDPSEVHMAERDLMEDEDLSVLLQLASNTPRSAGGDRPVAVSTSDGAHVFRPPNPRTGENLPSLQLPIIGGRDNQGHGARLARKTNSRDHNEPADGFRHMHAKPPVPGTAPYHDKTKKLLVKEEKGSEQRKDGVDKKATKNKSLHPPHPPYPLPHHYEGHPGAPPYYPGMPPGMPHSGSMRVVVGGPPPPPRGAKPPVGSPHGHRPYTSDPNYPPPPYPPPPPGHYHHPGHPGVPPPHMHPHYAHYPPHHHPHGPPRAHMPMYGAQHPSGKSKLPKKLSKPLKPGQKRSSPTSMQKVAAKKAKKSSPPKKKNKSPQLTDKADRQKAAATIQAVNAASGGKNDRAAALAAAILRGVTMRPSGKWQAQLYFAGKSRYIGVFDTREKAALAYEIAREKLKSEKSSAEGGQLSPKATEAAVTLARKAAFDGVNERDPRLASK